MPDYSIVGPLVDPVDRTQGISLSPLLSAAQGLEAGVKLGDAIFDFGNKLKFEPDKLIAEQVKRDLDNRVLEEGIREAKIANALSETYGARKEEAGLRNIDSTIKARDIQANAVSIDSSIQAATGMEAAQLAIKEKRQKVELDSIYSSRERSAKLDEDAKRTNLAAEQIRLEYKKMAFESNKATTQAFNKSDEGELALAEVTMAKRAYNKAIESGDKAKELKAQESLTAAEKQLGTAQKDFGILPAIEFSEAPSVDELFGPTRREAQMSALENSITKTENTVTDGRVSKLLYNAEQGETQAERDNAASEAVAEAARVVKEADKYGQPESAMAETFKVAEYIRQSKSPEGKTFGREVLADIVSGSGRVEEFNRAIAAEKDPEIKRGLEKTLAAALVQTGRLDLMAPEQQQIATVLSTVPNITPEEIGDRASDPNTFISETSTMLRNNADVKDDKIKTAMANHPYTAAARTASRNGTQGFQIATVQTGPGGSASTDVAGGDVQQMLALRFTGDDGTTSQVAPPTPGSSDEKVQRILEQVGKKASDKSVVNNQAQNQVQDIQGRTQGVNQGLQNPPQVAQPTTPGQPRTAANNLRNLVQTAGFNQSNINQLSEKSRSLFRPILTSAESGTFGDAKKLNELSESLASDLWSSMPDTQKILFTNSSNKESFLGLPAQPVENAPTEQAKQFGINEGKNRFIDMTAADLRSNLQKEVERIAADQKRILEGTAQTSPSVIDRVIAKSRM